MKATVTVAARTLGPRLPGRQEGPSDSPACPDAQTARVAEAGRLQGLSPPQGALKETGGLWVAGGPGEKGR